MSNTYLKAALITAAITLLGFFFISQLDAMRANEIRNGVDDLVFQSDSDRMLSLYASVMDNSSAELCVYASASEESRASQAYSLLEKINYYEKSNVVNSDYERIKNRYYLSNALLYLNMRAQVKYCGASPYTTVLFFYRVKTDCPECRAQGGVLDSLREKHSELRVFAFPSDSGLGFIDAFIKRHNITSVPSLVIDDSVVLAGLQSEAGVEASLANLSKPG
jgi:hypothetical protein